MAEAFMSTDTVNKHYLDKVIDLAEEMDIEATEDIYDARGMKLLAKGAKISHHVQERLIMRKLRKPLESCIRVQGGVKINIVVEEAKRIAETNVPVSSIVKSLATGRGTSPFDILSGAQIGNAMSMMLTITDQGGPAALSHSVMVSLVSVCLAQKIGLSPNDQMTVALAGLLHDIGELYIEPEYLTSKRRLLPHEWRHVVVHPLIGQMLISELENYPKGVALAVSEHHERFDGAGYPRRVMGKNISIAGQAVSVAEMISGVFTRSDKPLERAELAMKIIPGEHAPSLVSAISSVLRSTGEARSSSSDMSPAEAHQVVRNIADHITAALDGGRELLDMPAVRSKLGKDLLLQVLHQVHTIQRAFSSTGLYACLEQDSALFDATNKEILFEVAVATREIQWRLRDVARNLSLHSETLQSDEAAIFQPLITLIDAHQ